MDNILNSEKLHSNLEEYIYIHMKIYNLKINKNIVLTLINDTKWSGKNYYDIIPNSLWLFWIENNIKCPQFQAVFCIKCGNYLRSETNRLSKRNKLNTQNIFCYCLKKKMIK